MSIHVIDDEEYIVSSLATCLLQHCDDIQCFYSAEEYIDYMNSDAYIEPKFTLSDIRMQGMNGYDLVKYIRESGSASTIAVMTGFHNLASLSEINFDYSLHKPIDIDLLIQIVSDALEGQPSKQTMK